MHKTLSQALLAAFCAILVRGTFAAQMGGGSMIAAAHHSMMEKTTAKNLWLWPSEITRVSKSPQSVWTPQTGIWYGSFADNGYANTVSGAEYQTFTASSYHNYNQGGYSMVQFFALSTGTYSISADFVCETFSDNASFYVAKYVKSGNAYVHGGIVIRGATFETHDTYKTLSATFNASADDLVYIGISGVNSNSGQRRGCDIWNVKLVKA